MIEKRKKSFSEAPLGVKIISIISYIQALLFIGAIFYFWSNAGVYAFVSLIPAIISYFIAFDLSRGKNSMRWLVIILSMLGFLISLLSFNLIGLIPAGIIGGYLLFSKKVKEFYTNVISE